MYSLSSRSVIRTAGFLNKFHLRHDFSQLAYAPHFHPFDDKYIAGVIEAGPVGADEFARLEVIARELARGHVVAGGVIAEVFNDLIVAVHDGDARKQVGHDHIPVFVDIEVAWCVGPVEEVDVFAFERESLNAFIAAVSDIQHRLMTARVKNDAVRTLELAGFLAGAAEGADVFTLAVVLDDVA